MIAKFLLLGIMTFSFIVEVFKHGKVSEPSTANGWHALISYLIFIVLLTWGGFFKGML